MKNLERQNVPQARLQTLDQGTLKSLSSEEIFAGRNIILFALPGAFTPTCSSTHLPRYNELAPTFAEQGIDEIICLAVNDAFVMDAWQQEQGADNIRFLADGSGHFSAGMGALVSKDDLGFGNRSWRYSMLVRDGLIEKMFIEPQEPGDPFKVSDADTMLRYINSDAKAPSKIAIFTKPGCNFCRTAKSALERAELSYEEIVLGQSGHSFSLLTAVSGESTAPQVFVDGKRLGGSEALTEWLAGA